MNKRIIFPQSNGIIAIIMPTVEFLEKYSILDLAEKDVPAGIPYKIIDASDIPTDRTFRNAWQSDFTNPDGYGLGYSAWKEKQEKNQ